MRYTKSKLDVLHSHKYEQNICVCIPEVDPKLLRGSVHIKPPVSLYKAGFIFSRISSSDSAENKDKSIAVCCWKVSVETKDKSGWWCNRFSSLLRTLSGKWSWRRPVRLCCRRLPAIAFVCVLRAGCVGGCVLMRNRLITSRTKNCTELIGWHNGAGRQVWFDDDYCASLKVIDIMIKYWTFIEYYQIWQYWD